MRIKTRGGKSRFSKSAPLQPPNEDDAIGEDSTDEIRARDATAPDSEETEVGGGGNVGGDCMDMDWTEKGACIKCDGGDGGQVLFCSEIGCPVALHEKCMGNDPKFDDLGNFYCPYCSYKRAVARMQELRKKARLAKKALLDFVNVNSNVGCHGEQKEKDRGTKRKEPDISVPSMDENGYPSNEDRQKEKDDAEVADHDQCGRMVLEPETETAPSVLHCGDDTHKRREEKTTCIDLLEDSVTKEKSDEGKTSENRQFKIVEDGEKIRAEDPGEVDDSQHEDIIKGQQQAEPSNTCHLAEKTTADGAVSEENQGRREEEEQRQPEAQEATEGCLDTPRETRGRRHSRKIRDSISDPTVPENVNVGLEFSDLDNESLAVRQRIKSTAQHRISPRKSSSQRDTPVEENARNHIKKVDAPKKTSPGAGVNPRNQNKKVQTPQKSTPAAKENASNQIEIVTDTKKLGKHRNSAKQIRRPIIANARRRRLFWTTEEENMLREGVSKFSRSVNTKLPWRKILEFGSHIFDATRTPDDLKGKWRNITANESRKFS